MNFLTLEDVLIMAEAHLGFSPLLSNASVLESAVDRPIKRADYDSSADVDDLGAELLYGLARQQGLQDGNKRTAWVSTVLFYRINGFNLIADKEIQEPVVLRAALDIFRPKDIAPYLFVWRTK